MPREKIDLTDLGLEQILLDGVDVHIERMDADVVSLAITRAGKPEARLSLTLFVEGKKLKATVSDNELRI